MFLRRSSGLIKTKRRLALQTKKEPSVEETAKTKIYLVSEIKSCTKHFTAKYGLPEMFLYSFRQLCFYRSELF